MKYTVCESVVQIVGEIWQPGIGPCAMEQKLTASEVGCVKDYGDGTIDRAAVQTWLDLHTGDFQNIIDFSASIEDGADTINLPWEDEEHEGIYFECMYPALV